MERYVKPGWLLVESNVGKQKKTGAYQSKTTQQVAPGNQNTVLRFVFNYDGICFIICASVDPYTTLFNSFFFSEFKINIIR